MTMGKETRVSIPDFMKSRVFQVTNAETWAS